MESRPIDWAEVRQRFPAVLDRVYLNTASGGAPTRRTTQVAKDFHDDLLANADASWASWGEGIESTRGRLAAFVEASPAEVAFVPNAGTGMSCLAHLLDPGGNVVAITGEFPAVTLPWLQTGRQVRFVDPVEGVAQLDTIEAAIDPQTRAVVTSFVQYTSGFRQDIPALAELCRSRGVRLIVDATQGIGAMPLRLSDGPDAMVFSSYKWLCAGYGIAGLVVRRELLDPARYPLVGWRSAKQPYELTSDRLDLSNEARALEIGNVPIANILALGAALEIHDELGSGTIAGRVLDLTTYLRQGATDRGLTLRSPGPPYLSGISVIEIDAIEECAAFLAERNVHVAVRGGALRVSVHLYNDENDVDRFYGALDEFSGRS